MAADKAIIHDGPVYMPVEQYLALDDNTDGLYEYWHGIVIMLRPPSSAYRDHAITDMAGGSNTHAALCVRIASLLDQGLLNSESPCMTYSSDTRLMLEEDHYLHPDVTVACSEQPSNTRLIQPTLIVEVLSPATEERDRTAKFETYKQLPSLQEYVLVGSQYQAIEVHRREGKFWRPYHYRSGDLVELKSIGVSFPFDTVYQRIALG